MSLLPVESFREILGYSPWHWWGLANQNVPVTSGCNRVVRQYSWQDAHVLGRADISRAIEIAEERLADYLGYDVAPVYREDTVTWPKYHDASVWRTANSVGASGRFVSVRLPRMHLRSIGTEKRTLLSTPAVMLLDEDNDGLYDTFEIRVTTTITDPIRLGVYFTRNDRLDDADVSESARVKPLRIRFSGGQAIIRGRSWIIVRPINYEGYGSSALDPDVTAIYASTLEVYDLTTEADGETLNTCQAVMRWESLPHPDMCYCAACTGVTYTGNEFDPSAEGKAVARCGIRDAELGYVIPGVSVRNTDGTWAAQGLIYFREPERVTVRYQAGLALDNDGQMNRNFRTIVARLAAAELAGRPLNCEQANLELYRWQFDLARAAGANSEQYQISPADLDNPFGTKAGQVYAWKQVKNLALT